MKNGKIIISASVVALVAGACVMNTIKNNETPYNNDYSPRTALLKTEINSNEAQRQLWESRRLNEEGVYDPSLWGKTYREVQRFNTANNNRAVTLAWADRGPDNVGGRTRAIIVNETDQNHIIAGSVSGGLFESFDAGNTWSKIDGFPTCSVGSIAQLNVAPYTILVGTKDSRDPVGTADGIYESTDNGATWTLISGTSSLSFTNRIVAANGQDKFYVACSAGIRQYSTGGTFGTITNAPSGACNALQISEDNQIMIGNFGGTSRLSTDGGATWNSVQGGSNNIANGGTRYEYAISDVKVNGKYYVYASVSTNILVGEFVSTSNGEPGTWSQTAFASSPGFQPFNSGGSGQGNYDHAITTLPGRADKILLGGIDVYDWIMDPGSNPAFGQWTQRSLWSASPTSPIYVHADNHEFVFNKNGDLYIGNDGGIGRSPATAIGQFFFPSNKGYNVTQFYNMGYSAHGAVIGGSQDNGTQYNNFSNNTFLEHEEVRGGDGFTCDISILDDEVMIASVYYGDIQRSNDAGFTFNPFFSNKLSNCSNGGLLGAGIGSFKTVGRLWETANDPNSTDSIMFLPESSMITGDSAFVTSASLGIDIAYELTSPLTVADSILPSGTIVQGTDTLNVFLNPNNNLDTIEISYDAALYNVPLDTLMIQDPVQSWYALAVSGNGSCGGVWITRDAIRFANDPFWWYIDLDSLGIPSSQNIIDIEFSNDGNNMYLGTSNSIGTVGYVAVVSGIGSLYANQYDPGYAGSDETILPTSITYGASTSFSDGVSGIAVDPQDPNHIVIALAGYGTSQIRRSLDATSGTPTFTNIHGNLPSMPVHDAMIDRDFANTGLVVVGTEFGTFATDNLSTWDDISGDMGCVPVYSVRQNWRGFNEGSFRPGEIYAGTFGRGIWASDSYLDTPDPIKPIKEAPDFIASLNVYPNPMSYNGNIAFELNSRTNVTIEVYSLSGRKVKEIKPGQLASGNHIIEVNATDLASGTYIVNLVAGNSRKTAKFIVNR